MLKNRHFYLRDNSTVLANTTLSEKSKASIMMSKSDNTVDAYESDWNDFMDWCDIHNEKEFPPTPEIIVNYLNDLAEYAKANTISRRLSAISENLNAAGLTLNPCNSALVKSAIRGIRRQKGVFQQGKTPLLLDDIEEIVETMDKVENVDQRELIRDKAILLIGFLGAFRRSELAAIRVEDLRFSGNGLEILVLSSKADQEGQGAVVAIPYINNNNVCGVRALQNWLRVSKLNKGPIFRGFKKNRELRANGISDKMIAEIVKKYVSLIGLDPIMYGAHSLRHGFATTAAAYGVEERDIMRQTRHHSVNMVRRYINEANRFNNNPVATIFNKIRR